MTDVKAPFEATQKTTMGVDKILNSSKAVPSINNVANVSTSDDLTTSEELTNSHFKVCITSSRKKYCILFFYSSNSFSLILITKISDEFYLIRLF